MKTRQGFTLLEVLLAVFILGMGLAVFFGAANQGISVVADARAYELGRSLLQRVELLAPLNLEAVEEGEETGEFEVGNLRVEWSRQIRPVGVEEDRFFHLRTRVEWGEDGNRFSESVESYLHLPSALREDWVRKPAE